MGKTGLDGTNGKVIRDGQSFWKAHIKAQAKSGLSMAEYCRRVGISKAGFYYWKKKLATLASDFLISRYKNLNTTGVTKF